MLPLWFTSLENTLSSEYLVQKTIKNIIHHKEKQRGCPLLGAVHCLRSLAYANI